MELREHIRRIQAEVDAIEQDGHLERHADEWLALQDLKLALTQLATANGYTLDEPAV